MDLLVDTNVFVSDYQMRGAAFRSMFDYLRRTGSALVLLKQVQIELAATFERDLRDASFKADAATKKLRSLVSEPCALFKPDLESQIDKFNTMFASDINGVRTILHDPAIDLEEVVYRGARRIPPADHKGEELRDVIIWLAALDYTRSSSQEAAFITSDRGFWDGEQPKTQILEDVKASSGRLKLFKSLAGFLAETSLCKRAVGLSWLTNLDPINSSNLNELIAEKLQLALADELAYYTFTTVIETLILSEGSAFEIDATVSFVELQYSFIVSLEPSTGCETWRILGGSGPRTSRLERSLTERRAASSFVGSLPSKIAGNVLLAIRVIDGRFAGIPSVGRFDFVRLPS